MESDPLERLMKRLIAHRWYIFQGSIILGVTAGLINSFGPHYWKQFGLIGVVVALWVSVVINSIYRLRGFIQNRTGILPHMDTGGLGN